ncbi:MAG: hypothetical protein A2X94_09805 [Bdellovibrionales bacterium GWB1_55_8]|nr:MAG: hypothetical protein A2X94_09805 [Bdellovibrionales bacterium GWB1_55_8]
MKIESAGGSASGAFFLRDRPGLPPTGDQGYDKTDDREGQENEQKDLSKFSGKTGYIVHSQEHREQSYNEKDDGCS